MEKDQIQSKTNLFSLSNTRKKNHSASNEEIPNSPTGKKTWFSSEDLYQPKGAETLQNSLKKLNPDVFFPLNTLAINNKTPELEIPPIQEGANSVNQTTEQPQDASIEYDIDEDSIPEDVHMDHTVPDHHGFIHSFEMDSEQLHQNQLENQNNLHLFIEEFSLDESLGNSSNSLIESFADSSDDFPGIEFENFFFGGNNDTGGVFNAEEGYDDNMIEGNGIEEVSIDTNIFENFNNRTFNLENFLEKANEEENLNFDADNPIRTAVQICNDTIEYAAKKSFQNKKKIGEGNKKLSSFPEIHERTPIGI